MSIYVDEVFLVLQTALVELAREQNEFEMVFQIERTRASDADIA